MSDLDNLLSDDPIEEQEAPEPEEELEEDTGDTEGDEAEGDDEGETPEEPEKAADEPEKMVPLAALKQERESARELKRRLEEIERRLQPQDKAQEPPDFYSDPDARLNHERQQFQQQMTAQTLRQSRFFAERDFGKDEVEEAYAYFDQNPQESAALLNEPSPFHAAVEHMRRVKAQREIGDDPEAYKARLREELRKEVEAEVAANSVKSAGQARAPSLAGQSNLGSRQGKDWSGPSSLDDILGG